MSGQQSDLDDTVRKKFSVKQSFVLPDGGLEYQVAYDKGSDQKFVELADELAPKGFVPELTGDKEECVLTVRKKLLTPTPASRIPVILALFTVASLIVFSLLQRTVYADLDPGLSGYYVFFAFGGAIAALLGAHELGQRYVASRRGGGHASTYLIPGIPFLPPFLPSFGFASSQREPALNRNRLFDTVIAGPLAIIVLAVLLYVLGDLTVVQSTVTLQASQLGNSTVSVNPNVIQMAVDTVLGPTLPKVAPGFLLLSPIGDGATVGFILAFIGLLPMASYDGGFLTATAWGTRAARVASYLSVFALLVLDTPTYWALAIVVLLIAGRPYQLKLLDEVSGLSRSRKWLYLGALLLAFLCLPIPHNLATLPLG